MVRVRNVSFRFGQRFALRKVSFCVGRGGFVFLTGPSGAGKTTLLSILHGALPLQSGLASVAGHDLGRMTKSRLPALRRDVGVVFQDFKILPGRTVRENVALPLEVRGIARHKAERRIKAVLHALRLDGLADAPCAELAGGEQQRVAIARAVVTGPRVILADEPTGNLDWELSLRLLDVFRQFHLHGTTIIMATHNRDIPPAVPEAAILRLDGGEVDQGGYDVAEAAGLSGPDEA
ncbi:MAG: ATP-binding cassette domain-containing protein [Desulfovibrio sp.]|nr:ATP-binding cassette domain-containing protein [Desulfovibrio sp.]